MGAYKQFLASDIIITPFEVSKGFTFYVTQSLIETIIPGPAPLDTEYPIYFFVEYPQQNISYPGFGIERLLGENITEYPFNSALDPTVGLYRRPLPNIGFPTGSNYKRLVYNSTKQLYYTNYSESVYSDPVNNPILVPGRDEEGNRFIGEDHSPRYENYLQTNITYPRFFPTTTGSYIGVLSIPAGIYGNHIQPGSFIMSFPSGTFYDDAQGNIFTGSTIVGNITYTHGLVTLTGNETIYNASNLGGAIYGTAIYGVSVYGSVITLSDWVKILQNFYSSSNFTCSFSSSYTIYDTQYKCTIRENEYNFSLNPSLISNGSTGSLYGFATESYFSPYITTVGLYDDQQNLLAIGKLSQPLPGSPTTDTTILINIDK